MDCITKYITDCIRGSVKDCIRGRILTRLALQAAKVLPCFYYADVYVSA